LRFGFWFWFGFRFRLRFRLIKVIINRITKFIRNIYRKVGVINRTIIYCSCNNVTLLSNDTECIYI
jgi:hypothetical protein